MSTTATNEVGDAEDRRLRIGVDRDDRYRRWHPDRGALHGAGDGPSASKGGLTSAGCADSGGRSASSRSTICRETLSVARGLQASSSSAGCVGVGDAHGRSRVRKSRPLVDVRRLRSAPDGYDVLSRAAATELGDLEPRERAPPPPACAGRTLPGRKHKQA